MLEFSVYALCIIIFIISAYIVSYNVSIIAIQKTPIQQSWLSIGIAVQLMIPILFLIFRTDGNIRHLIFKYLSMLTMTYVHLYITKFNVGVRKHYVKLNLMICNTFIAYIAMYLILDIFKLKQNINLAGVVTNFLFNNGTIIMSTFDVYCIIAACGSLCVDFFNVRTSVNVIKILNILYELGLLIYLIRDRECHMCFHALSIMMLLIEVMLIKIICINKGRYYNDR